MPTILTISYLILQLILLIKVNDKLAYCPVITVSLRFANMESITRMTATNVLRSTCSEIIILSPKTLDIDISFFDLVTCNKGLSIREHCIYIFFR